MAINEKNELSFKDTLNLPRTDFPMRANAAVEDSKMLERWQQEDLYKKSFELHESKQRYILHDGPPYANGPIHLGHAYNKILKDIVTKSRRMSGMQVPVIPGWDCHGLPIELKVTQEQPGLSPEELKKACRAYANKWIEVQRAEFKKLGVLMDWERPYKTMDPSYEANILRAFGIFVKEGYIERKNKTVPWCFHDQTVLAAAEIEYQERKDPSVYALFPLTAASMAQAFPYLGDRVVNLLIWTTTPWSIPLNRAVFVHPKTTYVVLEHNDTLFLVGATVADKLTQLMGIEKKVVAEIPSEQLVGLKTHHPFISDFETPVLADPFVSLEDGTACVHSAPGCGPEDYEMGLRYNLEIYSPLSPDGKYTKGIRPAELEGMAITDGQIWVIKKLHELGKLLYKTSIKHSYPHCWRCHNGLMFRATSQWFVNLSQGGLRERALRALDAITFVPERSSNFLRATLQSRLEWCLSRQRTWGVPITALLCKNRDYAFVDQELIEKVAKGIEQHGIEYWDTVDINTVKPEGLSCPVCHSTEFVKEKDILDVWFESGVSHYAVLLNNPEQAFPADIYAEGVDQHRAWFQSSLLTSMVLEQEACFKSILTHGFTVDEKGRKMSKSLGNVVAPQTLIEQLGTDGLRLWASSISLEGDAIVSDVLLNNVKEVYRKVRNTCRFLLSNLYDFDPEKDAVPFDSLFMLDYHALEQLLEFNNTMLAAYETCDSTAAFHELGSYCASQLSSFYLDMAKDRLYVEKADGHARRSAQTVCWYILDTMTRLMAPILSFTAEQVSDHYQKNKKNSIHLQRFADLSNVAEAFYKTSYPKQPYQQIDTRVLLIEENALDTMRWQLLSELRDLILKSLEQEREKGIVKHSLEARVVLHLNFVEGQWNILEPFFREIEMRGQGIEEFFKEWFIVSQVEIVQGHEKQTSVFVEHARGDKCPRCWNWDQTTNEHHLCNRCMKVLAS